MGYSFMLLVELYLGDQFVFGEEIVINSCSFSLEKQLFKSWIVFGKLITIRISLANTFTLWNNVFAYNIKLNKLVWYTFLLAALFRNI